MADEAVNHGILSTGATIGVESAKGALKAVAFVMAAGALLAGGGLVLAGGYSATSVVVGAVAGGLGAGVLGGAASAVIGGVAGIFGGARRVGRENQNFANAQDQIRQAALQNSQQYEVGFTNRPQTIIDGIQDRQAQLLAIQEEADRRQAAAMQPKAPQGPASAGVLAGQSPAAVGAAAGR